MEPEKNVSRQKDKPPSGTWLTNTQVKYACCWPVRYGRPKATPEHTVKELEGMGLVGVYVV